MRQNNLRRPISRKVRFSKEENEYINRRIAASPFDNFQNFARILLITGEIKVYEYQPLYQLRADINRLGNNINQMAKLAHQFDEISSDDIQTLYLQLNEIKQLINDTLKNELAKERTM